MGRYTIAGLAKVNECNTHDMDGLITTWREWYICNCGSRRDIISDYESLRDSEKNKVIRHLVANRGIGGYEDLLNYILSKV